jgi:DNA repair protein RecO (recombination protein O)
MTTTICTTDGFVLRSIRYGDTSRVATIFSHDLGKFSVIAKGARVPGSAFGASLDLFTVSQFVVYYRAGRDLQMLKTGGVEHHFASIQTEPARFTLGCAILEFVDRMMLEGEPAPGLFALTLRALARIEQGSVAAAPEVLRAFQLRTAALLGYGLRLESCLHCGTSLAEAAVALGVRENDVSADPAAFVERSDPRSSWLFRPAEGGAICPGCAGHASGYSMTPRALLRLRAMVCGNGAAARVAEPVAAYLPRGNPLGADPDASASAGGSIASDSRRERWLRTLDMLVEDYLRFHVERYRGLRSLGSQDEPPEPRGARQASRRRDRAGSREDTLA